jgi:TolA-binding protein
MNSLVWLVLAAVAAAGVWLALRARRKWREREQAEAERFAAFMAASAAGKKSPEPAATVPAALPAAAVAAAGDGLAQQKLLFEAAHKAAEAGEPALAIQLYARLLARYPASAFAPQARAGVEAQKKRLVKA